MSILDYILIGILIICALVGFKKGFIPTIVAFIGTILVIILAYYLKNPISSILYNNLPFIKLGGLASGISVINILVYEGISYIITLIVLSIILGIIVKISGLFNKLVSSTVVIRFGSRILGFLCGIIEGFVIIFIISFLLNIIIPSSSLIQNSKYLKEVLNKTPFLSDITHNTTSSVNEIQSILKNNSNKEKTNLESLNTLLKYEVLSPKEASNLLEKGKIEIDGAKELIDNYNKKGDFIS